MPALVNLDLVDFAERSSSIRQDLLPTGLPRLVFDECIYDFLMAPLNLMSSSVQLVVWLRRKLTTAALVALTGRIGRLSRSYPSSLGSWLLYHPGNRPFIWTEGGKYKSGNYSFFAYGSGDFKSQYETWMSVSLKKQQYLSLTRIIGPSPKVNEKKKCE